MLPVDRHTPIMQLGTQLGKQTVWAASFLQMLRSMAQIMQLYLTAPYRPFPTSSSLSQYWLISHTWEIYSPPVAKSAEFSFYGIESLTEPIASWALLTGQ